MIVKTLMEKLEKMDQNAIVRLNGAMGEEVLFIKKHAAEQSLDCDQSLVWLKTESDVDMEKIIKDRLNEALINGEDETDVYSELLESGINLDMVEKYLGSEQADHMEACCREHGLI